MRTARLSALIFFLASGAAAPTTEPQTQPATAEELGVAQAELERSKDALEQAQGTALKRFRGGATYLQAKAELDSKLAARERARQGSDMNARLRTDSAYNQARLGLGKKEAAAVDEDAEVQRTLNQWKSSQARLKAMKASLDEADRKREQDRQQAEEFAEAHPRLVALLPQIDALQITPPATASSKVSDTYSVYSSNSSKVVQVARLLHAYLSDTQQWDHDDLLVIWEHARVVIKQWRSSLTEREREYPSADAIVQCFRSLQSAGNDLNRFLPVQRAQAKDAADDSRTVLEARAILQRLVLATEADWSRHMRDADALATDAHKLLVSREGTQPVLPPRAPHTRP